MPRRRVAKPWGEGSRRAVAAALLLSFALRAMAAEIRDMQYHEKWVSFVLASTGEATVRMATEEEGAILALDLYPDAAGESPGACEVKLVKSVSASESAELEAFLPLVLSGKIRVDREKTHPVSFHFSLEDGCVVIRLAGDFHRQLLREGEKGSVLRMKIGTDSPVYLAFSLRGFTAARNRSLRLLEETKRIYPPHRDFFEEEKPAPPARRKGGARFL